MSPNEHHQQTRQVSSSAILVSLTKREARKHFFFPNRVQGRGRIGWGTHYFLALNLFFVILLAMALVNRQRHLTAHLMVGLAALGM